MRDRALSEQCTTQILLELAMFCCVDAELYFYRVGAVVSFLILLTGDRA